MARRDHPTEDQFKRSVEEAVQLVQEHGTLSAASRATGIPYQTLQHRFRKADAVLGVDSQSILIDAHARLESNALIERKLDHEQRRSRELSDLKAQLRIMESELNEARQSAEHFAKFSTAQLAPPKWMTPKIGRKKERAIMTAFLSDCHFDEYVDPAQINFVNGYGRQIAEERLERFFHNVVRVGRDYINGIQIDGLILPLGGDMLSGNIHEELKETNEDRILPSVLHWSDRIAAGIEMMVKTFGKVFVPCVVGNHGRLSRKPVAKNRVEDNFDWLMYKLLERHFNGTKEVQFLIPRGADARWRVYGTRMQMTHGDQFRGGTGISGLFSPITLGDHRKRKREQSTASPYDVLIMGHWHQLIDMGNAVVNGSLKGYDEYAFINNFPFEPPRQAFWLTDPTYGRTIRGDIHVLGEKEQWRQTDVDHPVALG